MEFFYVKCRNNKVSQMLIIILNFTLLKLKPACFSSSWNMEEGMKPPCGSTPPQIKQHFEPPSLSAAANGDLTSCVSHVAARPQQETGGGVTKMGIVGQELNANLLICRWRGWCAAQMGPPHKTP